MANPWFRLYAEFAHDPKVQMLSEVMQRRYIMLMCMRCSNALVTLHETEIAFHMRISEEELASTKALFVQRGFIDSEWNLLNWEKRQFASDSSAARVARHREKKKRQGNGEVTLQKRSSNAPDTDTDTDTDKEDIAAQPRAKKSKPRTSVPANFRPEGDGLKAATDAGLNVAAEVRRFIDHHEAKGSLMASWPAAWRTWVNNAVSFGKGTAPKPSADLSWLSGTGFDNEDEARNFGCTPSTASQFRDGKRIREAA